MKYTSIAVLILIALLFPTQVWADSIESETNLKLIFLAFEKIFILMFVVFIFSKTKTLAHVLSSKATFIEYIWIIVFFSIAGIYGTVAGVDVGGGAISNTRDLGPLMAGFIGGPIIGLIVGIIAAIHRFILGGLTKIPCSIATIFAGLVAGLFSKSIRKNFSIQKGFIIVVVIELIHMGLILLISKPYPEALYTVKKIILAMVLGNSVGIITFLYIMKIRRVELSSINPAQNGKINAIDI